MSAIFLRRGGQLLQNRHQGSLLRINPIGLRYVSLNSAIGRGLRKSQGVGFRGRERTEGRSSRNSTSDDGKSLIRRSSEVPGHARAEAPITRDGIRRALAVGERNVFGRGTDATTRLRRGKVDIKDSERPVKRSRAARFHDPDSSFGKKSAARRDRFEQRTTSIKEEREQGSLGRRRPFITDASHRAALSDLKERDINPDSSKLSTSRLAYLERTAGQASRQSQQNDYGHKGFQERQEPFVESSIHKSRELDRDLRYNRGAARSRFDNADEPRDFDRTPKDSRDAPRYNSQATEWSETRDAGREPRRRDDLRKRFDDSSKPRFRDFDRVPKYSHDENSDRYSRGRRPERESGENEVKVRSTFDKHIPLSIPYTTPASEFLYGTSVIEAALSSRRSPRRQLYKLYIYNGDNREVGSVEKNILVVARRDKVPIEYVGTDGLRLLDKMSGGRPHNGYILEASPLPKLPVASLGRLETTTQWGFRVTLNHQSREEAIVNGTHTFVPVPRGNKPFVLLLDSILDPGNLGAMIRTASFLGVNAVAISTRNSAPFTPVVLKASAGASENITIFSVKSPAEFLTESKYAGWKLFAAVAPPSRKYKTEKDSNLVMVDELGDPLATDPCILMLGNEGEGLRKNLRSKAHVEVAIEGCETRRSVDSLNVSVALGILCNSFLNGKNRDTVEVNKVNEEVSEEVKEDVREVSEEVREDVIEEANEEIREEAREEVREEIIEEVREKASEEVNDNKIF